MTGQPDDIERGRRLEQAKAEYLAALASGAAAEPREWLERYPEIETELHAFFAIQAATQPARAAYPPGDSEATVAHRSGVSASGETVGAAGRAQSETLGAASPGERETVAIPPGATAELRGEIPDGETVGRPESAPPAADEGANGSRAVLPDGTRVQYFGDYELQKVLGRGGMGVVYKAKQISLNRSVALKMIRDAAFAGEEELRRFQNEAEAVATLDHPNIVPILEINKFGDQRYFSMKLISGGGLDRLIGELQGNYRAIAELMAKVADAIQHAHMRGILHRDLKPANILVDEKGEPHVTDFGLAKKVEGDTQLTQTGAIMGTPAFMAPEQASGRRGAITTATDVYGLGAILYTLLAGRAPFGGDSVMATLDQVRNRAPEPPTRVNERVPRDLEVICLKSLEKESNRRYISAGALADDLKRWLAGEPIEARPVGSATRAWMWARRNPVVASLAASVFLLSLVVAIASTVFALRLDKEKKAVEVARNDAQARAVSEAKARTLADENAEAARKAKKAADDNALLAENQAFTALSTIQALVGQVDKRLADVAEQQKVRQDILAIAMAGLSQIAKVGEKSTSIEATRAAIHMQQGNIYRQLGQSAKALEQYQLCHDITTKRVVLKNYSDASRSNLAASFLRLGEMAMEVDRDMDKALKDYIESLKLREAIRDEPRTDSTGQGKQERKVVLMELGEAYMRVGATRHRLGDPKAGRDDFLKALAVHEDLVRDFPGEADFRQNLARNHLALGETNFRLGDLDRAKQEFAKSLEERERLAAQQPTNLFYTQELANLLAMYGEMLVRARDNDAALPLLERARTLGKKLYELRPSDAIGKRDLSLTLYRLGAHSLRSGDKAKAADYYKQSLDLRRDLARDDANERRRMELMLALAHNGRHEDAADLASKLLARPSIDAELLLDVARAYAQCAEAAGDDAARGRDYRAKCLDALRKAIAKGYRDRVYLETEVDLDPMRSSPEFSSLVEPLPKNP